MIGASMTVIYLINGTIIDNSNNISVLHGGLKYLLYTSHHCEFCVVIHDVSKCHGER